MDSCPYSRGRRPANSAQNSSSSIRPKVSRPSVHRNPNFRDITRSVEQNEILNETFRVVSRFPRYISCISRKIDYLWDSAGWRKRGSGIKPETSVRRSQLSYPNRFVLVSNLFLRCRELASTFLCNSDNATILEKLATT